MLGLRYIQYFDIYKYVSVLQKCLSTATVVTRVIFVGYFRNMLVHWLYMSVGSASAVETS